MQMTIAAAFSVSTQSCSLVNWLCVHDTTVQLMPVCLYAQKHKLTHAVFMQVAVVNKFDLPYEVIGTDRKSRLRIMPRIS